ncbi:MAG: hypothetical protein ACOCQD_04995 [archaeon]
MSKPTEIGSPITEFIRKTKEQTEKGLDDWELKAPIEMELNTIVKDNKKGGIDINVINFGVDVEGHQQQKIKFSIGPKDPVKDEEDAARIAEARKKKENAEFDSNEVSIN